MNTLAMLMPSCRRILLMLALGASATAFAEPARAVPATPDAASRTLTKFNLDFPGGTPGELVAAIEKASGRPVNVIIPPEDAARQLPPLKMTGIDVGQLFTAISEASRRFILSHGVYGQSEFGFRSQAQPSPTDDSIWYFWVQQPPKQPKTSQFFLLKPFLAHGLTVDDITTAVETAWKMEGALEKPLMSYHKETNLLIVVGAEEDLVVVRRALRALRLGSDFAPSGEEDEKPAPKKT